MKKSIYFLLAVVSLLFYNCNKDEIDDLKERVDKIESVLVTDLQKELAQTKDSISAINQKINTLARELSTVAGLADDIEQLRADLARAQQNFVTICEDAIASAMADNNSVISGEIAASLSEAREEWEAAIRLVDDKITSMTTGATSVQGLTYIPSHVDGKATMSYNSEGSKATLDFFVAPKSIVKALKAEHISAQAVYTASTRGVTLVELPVTNFECDTVNGTISVEVSGEKLSEEFFNGAATASMFLKITYGTSECVSESIEFELVKLPDPVKPLGDITNPADVVTGDYAMVDGTFISGTATLTDEQKAGVAGIVYWTTKDTDVTASLADDKILKADFPNCTHGLILALTDANSSTIWQSTNDRLSVYQSGTFSAENKDDYFMINVAGREGYEDEAEYILGYQNTKLLRAYNEYQTTTAKKVSVITELVNFEAAHPAPKNSTGWFVPSLKELFLLVKLDGEYYTPNAVNSNLEKLGTYANKLSAYYWTSYESSRTSSMSGYALWYNVNNQGQGNASKTSRYAVRAVCAF